jgi:NADPH-dependent 2,4-dienoyl-CoA reductase/sulfur reductase-like enzyme
MGMQVTVVEMLDSILMATTEPEMISTVEEKLDRMGIRLLTGQRVEGFGHIAGKVEVALSGGSGLDADLVVLSMGVSPNTETAARAGLKVSRQGIRVDEYLRTSAADIFACGDCAETFSFINRQPVRGEFGTNAVFMGKVVARNILGHEVAFPGVINANATTVYDLSLGSAGFTEAMARDAGIDVVTGFSSVMDKYPMMDGVETIHTKLIFDRRDQKLVGGSVLRNGVGASQHVDFISFAIQMGATLDHLLTYQYATHPELAEKPSDNAYVFAAREARSKLKWE